MKCSETDALVLCGGLGTRLRPVLSDRPKALAEIAGRPFLDLLIDELISSGLNRFVLCTGYGSEQIAAHYRDRGDGKFTLSTEDRPLGTGGAVIHGLKIARSDPVIIVNGDSLCRVNYTDLLAFHRRSHAILTIVTTPPAGRDDAGAIHADDDGRIAKFSEKLLGDMPERHQVNAGIYVMQRQVVDLAPRASAFSLEHDLFPAAVRSGRCFVFPVSGPLIDIGTPERLQAAQVQIPELEPIRGDEGSVNS